MTKIHDINSKSNKHTSLFFLLFSFFLISSHLSVSAQQLPNLLLYQRKLNSVHSSYAGNHSVTILYHKGLLLVPGQVNQKTGYFLLDTGAPFLLVNEAVAEGKEAEVAQGLQGTVQLGKASFEKLDWGIASLTQAEANHADLSHLSRYLDKPFLGILGQEAFAGKQLFIDYQQQELFVGKGSQPVLHLNGAPAFEWHFEQIGHVILVAVTIEGKNAWFILDTGSVNSLIDREEAAGLNITAASGNQVMLESVDHKQNLAGKISPNYFSIQGKSIKNVRFLTTDMSNVRNTLEFPVSGIIGNDLLSRYSIAIDYKERKIKCWENTPATR